ncbi:MAG: aromatic ring-hydroxylating dioxygenase subunit alpha [Immundisolibacter sp.]|uniref:aromatic ring-hydroxylating oxygenase subunit alpha n=1 Tax=Immundisolibacter sp. TaxID=1934948 RepID=UPI001992EED8|nr:aromatic ring-hydroxylating dioxygenase subunit alpha [Immundisolibacter sp.]MBC7160806.1 aromatic ring-hydroxylating dioxygenase subunit alpha [Immundisolibacter sp.]
MKPNDTLPASLPRWPAAFNQVPKWAFEDADVFALEHERIFRGPVWHPVAHDAELPKPGDYKTVTVGRTPLLIIRGDDGVVRAFHNACTHRSTRLAMAFRGHSGDIECPYHRWVFDTRGQLRSCPGEAEFPPDFKRADYNLAAPRTGTHMGLLFVSLHASPPPLMDWMGHMAGPVRDALGGDGRLTLLGYQKVRYQSNWKVYIDNDAFHAPLLHAAFRILRWQGGSGRQSRLPAGHMMILSEVAAQPSDGGLLRDPSVIGYQGGAEPRNKAPAQAAGSSLLAFWPLTAIANHLDIFNIRYANPVGLDQVEVHYAYFAHADDDADMVRHRLRQSSNMIGPSGFVSLEDATVFLRIQQALDTDPSTTFFLKGYREGADLTETKQNDEAPNALWWEHYRQLMGFVREEA